MYPPRGDYIYQAAFDAYLGGNLWREEDPWSREPTAEALAAARADFDASANGRKTRAYVPTRARLTK